MGEKYTLEEITNHDIHIMVGVGSSDAKLGIYSMSYQDKQKLETMSVFECLSYALGKFVNKTQARATRELIEDILVYSDYEDTEIALNYDFKNTFNLCDAKNILIKNVEFELLPNDQFANKLDYRLIIRVDNKMEFCHQYGGGKNGK